jgi:hypothetical protein
MSKTWGYHLLLDCTAGDKELIGSKENIYNFIKELVVVIDMTAFGEPWIERFATHAADKAGYSLCQMIETSNITGHFCDNDGNFYISIMVVQDGSKVLYNFEELFEFEIADQRENTTWYGKWPGYVRPNFPIQIKQLTTDL